MCTFYSEIQEGHQKWWDNNFCILVDAFAHIPGIKKWDEIVLSHTISEINGLLCFTQKFQDGHQKWWHNDCLKKRT